ncbi:MAG TPA: hypothetical protein VFF79_06140 [Conexibacter sp.]|jgi:hypothetical protein|nr:hypothetical protein [Conexibacter sp.]
MRSFTLTFAAVAIAAGILAPAGLAKKRHCPPGSDAPEYCQHDPGYRGEHGGEGGGRGEGERGNDRHRHNHHRRSSQQDGVVAQAGHVSGERARQ